MCATPFPPRRHFVNIPSAFRYRDPHGRRVTTSSPFRLEAKARRHRRLCRGIERPRTRPRLFQAIRFLLRRPQWVSRSRKRGHHRMRDLQCPLSLQFSRDHWEHPLYRLFKGRTTRVRVRVLPHGNGMVSVLCIRSSSCHLLNGAPRQFPLKVTWSLGTTCRGVDGMPPDADD